mmetsp:Transcript_31030/g.70985  ORF Transcript_31030/g.70985 Transcript_31030/m.70985 type:complete len:409 (+) Transcript_31030:128-1354(+)
MPVVDLGLNMQQYIIDKQGRRFEAPRRYRVVEPIGQGAYGVVCSGADKQKGEDVAIKKIENGFEHLTFAKRTLRELRVLRHLSHENVIGVREVFFPGSILKCTDIYVVTELMETDLASVLKSPQPVTDEHCQFFLYQIVRGIKYIHSAGLIHRDLKPRNLLVNSNCDLKICDFGLARGVFNEEVFQNSPMTEYVCTRWYRATEVLCSWPDYGKASDIWSIGCIFAEMIRRKPLFPGRSTQQQLQLIVAHLGLPTTSFLNRVPNIKCRKFLLEEPGNIVHPLNKVVQTTSQVAFDILNGMLVFDPEDRLTATDLLEQPYLSVLHSPDDEPVREPLDCADFEFERRKINMYAMRQEILSEALQYHPEKQTKHLADRRGYSIFSFPMLQRGETHHSDDDELTAQQARSSLH